MNNKRTISILGSTGSIGRQTLDVLESADNGFELNFLTANSNYKLLAEQAQKYKPKCIVITDDNAYDEFKKISDFSGKLLKGKKSLVEVINAYQNDLVVSALVGFSGVEPTLHAIRSGSDIALANKETLVSAGKIITEEARKNNVNLLAVDSEHSAILQCLAGESQEQIEKIILTASGGPFKNTSVEKFNELSVKDALNHPNWSMGNKITIDSATMMNKGFEIIEAFWLFDINIDQIDVLVHPQSIVHSLVQFVDGSVKAQLGLPDMRVPIAYALNYPNRLDYDFPRMDLAEIGNLTFEKPDEEKFKCLKLSYKSLEEGGNIPAVVNAVNEVAVELFLNEKIKFNHIPELIERVLEDFVKIESPTIDEIIETDILSRKIGYEKVNELT